MPEAVPSCLADHAMHMPDLSIGKGMIQNLVTCHYQTKLAGFCRHVTVTWIKNVMGQGLCVTVEDPSCRYRCNVQIKPWYFWRKQSSKSFEMCGSKVEVFWDLSSAKYLSGPEPSEDFFLAVVSNNEVVLLLGDKHREAYKRTKGRPSLAEATFLSKTEHVFGKKYYCTKARFEKGGKPHDIVIVCQTTGPKEPYLSIKIDKQLVVHVKKLIWKFRGNQTVFVDGVPIEIFWDVHNWFFHPQAEHAMFMFQSCLASEQLMKKKDVSAMRWSGTLSNASASADKLPAARSLKDRELRCFSDFTVLLYAWKSG